MTKSKVKPGGREAPYSFEDAARSYLHRRRRGRTTERTAEALVKLYGGRPVSELTSAVLDAYVERRLKEVQGPTVRREVTTFAAILKMAAASGRLAAAPTVVRPEDGEPRLRSLDGGEVFRLLSPEGFEEEKALAVFMMNTGARVGEAVALSWADFEWAAGAVVLRSRKGRGVLRERRVPINDTVRVVVGCPARLAKAKPFRWASSAAASAALDRLADSGGVADFTSHDLRRTFACNLLARNVDVRVVAELLGHTSLSMVMRYAVPTRELQRAAVAALCSPATHQSCG